MICGGTPGVVFSIIASAAIFSGCNSGPAPPDSVQHAGMTEATGTDAVPDAGVLTIYEVASQIGTVANRVFRDSQGRLSKTIYYTAGPFRIRGPYTEESLRVQSVVIYKYDDQGRKWREEHYGPDLRLQRIKETAYQDSRKTIVWRRADETREYEIRYSETRAISHLFFDLSGRNLVGLYGAMPPDLDLAWGWGPSAEGLVCGIGANRTNAPLEDIRVYVMVRNLTQSPANVATALQYHIVQMELRDGKGEWVPQNTDYIRKRDRDLIRINRGTCEAIETIEPNHVICGEFGLQDWYDGLASGTYHLIIRRRASGGDFSLVSNVLVLEVQAGRQESPPR